MMFWNNLLLKRAAGGLPVSISGWPATVKVEDPRNKGKIGVEIYDSYATPNGIRTGDIFASFLSLALVIDMIFLALEAGSLEFFVGAIAGLVGASYIVRRFFVWLFKTILWVRIFPDRVEIAGWRGFQTYSTNIGYGFRLEEHDQTVEEELRVRKNPGLSRYYSNSKRLSLLHGKQSVLLADIYPQTMGKQAWDRLSAIQHQMEIGAIR